MGVLAAFLGALNALLPWLQVVVTLGVAIWCTVRKVAVAGGWVLFVATLGDAVLGLVRYGTNQFLWQFVPESGVQLATFVIAVLQLVATGLLVVGFALLRAPEPAP